MTPLQVAIEALDAIETGSLVDPVWVAHNALAEIRELQAQQPKKETREERNARLAVASARFAASLEEQEADAPPKPAHCEVYECLTTMGPDCPCESCAWHRRYLFEKHLGVAGAKEDER